MTVVSDWLAFHADRTPDKLAMVDQVTGRKFTYYEFNDRSTRLASHLRDKWGDIPVATSGRCGYYRYTG